MTAPGREAEHANAAVALLLLLGVTVHASTGPLWVAGHDPERAADSPTLYIPCS